MQIIKINGKQTKITTSDGKRYKAKVQARMMCSPCAFLEEDVSCTLGGTGKAMCLGGLRKDGNEIVWKLRKEKPTVGANTCKDA